jgi:hypothetical protein
MPSVGGRPEQARAWAALQSGGSSCNASEVRRYTGESREQFANLDILTSLNIFVHRIHTLLGIGEYL